MEERFWTITASGRSHHHIWQCLHSQILTFTIKVKTPTLVSSKVKVIGEGVKSKVQKRRSVDVLMSSRRAAGRAIDSCENYLYKVARKRNIDCQYQAPMSSSLDFVNFGGWEFRWYWMVFDCIPVPSSNFWCALHIVTFLNVRMMASYPRHFLKNTWQLFSHLYILILLQTSALESRVYS